MDKINLLTNALYRTLTAPEDKVLEFPELEGIFEEDRTETSPSKIHSEQLPSVINIFDFDGTLFSSPEPNPEIWESRLVGLLKSDTFILKGWYQDKRSLRFEHLEKQNGLENRWNNQLVDTVKQSMRAKNTLTVLLTGRNYDEFHELITEMVEIKGMRFDVMGFKPSHNILDWQLYYKTNVIEKIGRSTYEELIMNQTIIETQKLTTKEFKTNFIRDLISHNSPPISINIWEDRENHVRFFETYLEKLKSFGAIKQGTVYKVVIPMIYFEPFREYDIVMEMIKDYNENLALNNYRSAQSPMRRIGIIRKIQYAGIFFGQHVIDQLKESYPPPNVNGEWVFDGAYVHIRKYTNDGWLNLNCGGRGAIVTMRVIGFGLYRNRIYCLQVSEHENSQARTPNGMRCGKLVSDCSVPFINFAYVKGAGGFSDTQGINFNWVPIEHNKQIVIQGVIAAKYIMGLY